MDYIVCLENPKKKGYTCGSQDIVAHAWKECKAYRVFSYSCRVPLFFRVKKPAMQDIYFVSHLYKDGYV